MKKQTFSKTNESGPASFAPKRNSPALERQHSFGPNVCVQREAVGTAVHPAAPALVREVIDSPGQPLDSETRSAMEPRFGYDFSGVRVHTDETAAASARAVSAKAYTAGSHMVFDAGQHAPSSSAGQRLMAHELTHVVQQASGPVSGIPISQGMSVSTENDSFEQDAAANAKSKLPKPSHSISQPESHGIRTQPSSGQLNLQRLTEDTASGIAGATAGGVSAVAGIGSLIVAGLALSEAREQNRIGRKGLEFSERQADAAEFQAAGGFAFDSFSTIGPFYNEHKKLSDDKAADREENAEEGEPIPLIHVVAGEDNAAVITLTLKSNGKDILGGIIEQGDTRGYVGGPRAASGSLTITGVNQSKTILGDVATAVIHFRGTNRAAGPIQRFHGKVVVGANGVVYHVECSHTPSVGVADCESRRQPPIIVGMRPVLKENPSSGELPAAAPAPRKQPGADDVSSGEKKKRRGEDAGDAGPEPPARTGTAKRA